MIEHVQDRSAVVEPERDEFLAAGDRVQEESSRAIRPVPAQHGRELQRLFAGETDAADNRHTLILRDCHDPRIARVGREGAKRSGGLGLQPAHEPAVSPG